MAIYELFVDQFLPMDQGNSSMNPQGAEASNSLSFIEVAKNYRSYWAAVSFLNLGQVAEVRKSINHISVSDYLDMHHGSWKFNSLQEVTQYLILGSLARVVEYEIVVHDLTITQTVVVELAKAGVTTLTLTQSVTPVLIRSRTITQTLIVYQGGVAYLEDEENYSITLPTLTGPNTPEC